jgi:hypothetical protein
MRILCTVLALVVSLLASPILRAAIIDPALIPTDTAWQTAGVPGGIPSRTTIYTTLSSGATQAQIQTAIDNCPSGQVVVLGAGTYSITSGITKKAGVTLRGSGATSTSLQYTGTSDVTLVGAPGGSLGTRVNLTSTLNRGATTFSAASVSGVTEGGYVVLLHTNPAWVTGQSYTGPGSASWLAHDDNTRTMAQIVKVTDVTGTTVTFTPAVYLDMNNTPGYRTLGVSSGVGIEDLMIEKTQTSGGGSSVWMRSVAESWIKGCVIKWPQATAIRITDSWGCTVENCVIDSTNFSIDHESGRSYGVFFFDYNSNHLVQNNVVMGARHALVFEGGGNGIVMAHNASMAPRNNDTGNYATITEDMNTHGAHPYMNLWEGNVGSRIVHDNTWGSSSHNLSFRVWSRGYTENYADSLAVLGRVGIWVSANNPYNSFVGCVLLRPGDDTRVYGSNYNPIDWSLGQWLFDGSGGTDSNTIDNTYLHGIYSFKSLSTTWDAGNADHAIPNSMYLAAQPSWWDGGQWPSNGPDLTDKSAGNPAYRRYLAYIGGGETDYAMLLTNENAPTTTTRNRPTTKAARLLQR